MKKIIVAFALVAIVGIVSSCGSSMSSHANCYGMKTNNHKLK